MNASLPLDLRQKWGHLPDIRQRRGNEWSSACPQCGGADIARRDASDRFRMFAAEPGTDARGWCRGCGFFAWANDDTQRPTPAQIEASRAERLKLVEQENRRIKAKIDQIADAEYWRGWHDAMSQQQRQLWHGQGIIDYFIDYYQLGYNTNYTCYYDGQEWHTPTMTIPHYDDDWQLVNIQHRLMQPPEPGDKYRQMKGLPASMFRTEPERPLTGPVLVVEGAKKAIVTYQYIGESPDGYPLTVVSVPSKSPSFDMLDRLSNCEPVFVCLDPDAYTVGMGKDGRRIKPAVYRTVKALTGRCKVMQLPVKPDDFFTMYGGNMADFVGFMRQAVSV